MLPLRDNIPSRSTPFINYLMIAICGVVFAFQLADENDGRDEMVERLGMIPVRITRPDEPVMIPKVVLQQTASGIREVTRTVPAAAPSFPAVFTLLTCIFLHGGWAHFIGNMWFLYIFGDNVEDRLGHFGYLVFYLVCGVAASTVHLLSDRSSIMPTIGASGAIAGVMGAYMLLYPRATVMTLIPLVVFMQIVSIPAPIFLGIWFLMQIFSGFGEASGEGAGIAWWAHIGGFVVGVAIAFILNRLHFTRPRVDMRRPNSDSFHMYRLRS